METKYTKGKWNVFYQDDDIHIENEKKSEILTTLIGWNNHLEGKANALLISKSPEMLEMLERSLKEIRHLKAEYKDVGHCNKYLFECEKLIKQATEI